MEVLQPCDLGQDEVLLLKPNHHSLDVLTYSKPETQHTSLTPLKSTLNGALAFALTLISVLAPFPLNLFSIGCLAMQLIRALLVLGLLALSSYAGDYHHNAKRSLFYWSWWPVWSAVLCVAGVVAGALVGHLVWATELSKYSQLQSGQTYMDISPAVVPGKQIQDAGIVDFSQGTSIDREHGGCHQGDGHTYCVAPILKGGRLGNAPSTGSYDYFAVGVDCCSCPNNDFRCGDWQIATAHGGLRSTDEAARPHYRLAIEAWSKSFGKAVNHPLLFDWVATPAATWQQLRKQTFKDAIASIAAAAVTAVLLSLGLNRLMEVLVEKGYACNSNTPPPPAGFESSWATFLPEMLNKYKEEQLMRSYAAMEGNYGAAGPQQAIL